MGHQGPCSLPSPRVIAGEDVDDEQVLENDVKRRNASIILLVMWSGPQAFLVLTFPSMSVTSPNLILSGWISGSLALLWKWAGLIRRLRLSLPPRCSRFRW